ncbi:MAG TPA: VOC family protein [Bacteroidota bacterium]|nr:VOC family protein [Bacteroidota bacterium]
MSFKATYVHTNLIAHDWQRLANFYINVFGCTPVPPERHFEGKELERGTGVNGARLDGVHLRLQGYSNDGPTLEIFSYSPLEARASVAVNRPGFGHIAFLVDNVRQAREETLQRGGHTVGEIVTLQISTGKKVTWCYVTDPEGNVVELQSWSE